MLWFGRPPVERWTKPNKTMEKKINLKQPQLNLRKVMNKKNVGDQWLADQLGISRTSVSQIINGHTSPSLDRLYEIADALEVHFFDLFG